MLFVEVSNYLIKYVVCNLITEKLFHTPAFKQEKLYTCLNNLKVKLITIGCKSYKSIL